MTLSTLARRRGTRLHLTVQRRWRDVRSVAESGMTTAEYAVGTLAACAFAAVLMAVVKSGAVSAALTKLITSALAVGG